MREGDQEEEERPLRLSGSRALELQHSEANRPHGLQTQRDDQRALLPLLAAVAALLLVIIGTWVLVFNPPNSTPHLSSACMEVLKGAFGEHFSPSMYNLSLSLPPPLFTVDPSDPAAAPTQFSGSVAITFEVQQAAGCILLHAVGMQFLGASLAVAGEKEEAQLCSSQRGCGRVVVPVPPAAHPLVSTLDEGLVAVDLLGRQLQPREGAAMLRLSYTGALGQDGEGLHRSDPFVVCEGQAGGNATADPAAAPVNTTGEANGGACRATVLLATQLEPIAARRLLPCFDGPRFKARFQVSLEVPNGLTALSNMPSLKRTPYAASRGETGPSMDLVVFETSPLMSPYLLALAVGKLQQLEMPVGEGRIRHLAGGPEVRLWAVPGKEGQLRLAQTAAEGALSFFTTWTGVEQPLRKFDFVAVPGKGGAMENFGLLMFDETRFLVNEVTEGAYGAWLAADVICHEVAHQWFGNLVTASEWTQLTLNEGLASFMEYKCIEAVFPQMPARALFFRATSPSGERLGIHEGPLQRALSYDSDPLLPPLVPDSELQNVPGVIIYSKGASLLHLLEATLEGLQPGSFQAGLKVLLQQHMYSTATVADLLAALASQVATLGSSSNASGTGPSSLPAEGQQGVEAPLALFAQLAWQYAAAYSTGAEGSSSGSSGASKSGGSSAALAANSLAAWLHCSGYPLLNYSSSQQVMPDDGAVEQRRFCAWAAQDSSEEEPPERQAGNPCPPSGGGVSQPWWLPPSTSAGLGTATCLGQATDNNSCPANRSSSTSSSSFEASCASSPLLGAGLWRAAYSEQQLGGLLEAVKGLGPCFLRANTSTSGQDRSSSPLISSTSSSCSDLGAGTCWLDAGPLLAGAAVVEDTFALSQPGQAYPASWVLRAAQGATLAPVSSTGSGRYLLVLPAAEALLSLRPLVAGNARCSGQLETFATKLLAPHAARALGGSLAGGSVFVRGAVEGDDFLGALAASRLGWQAALGGDNATATALCSALPATPLWGWVGAAREAEGGNGLSCPPGFLPATPPGSSQAGSSAAALCKRSEAGNADVPGGLQGTPGPDLLPAIYIAAAAGAGAAQCAQLQEAGVTPSLFAQALRRCWEEEADDTEASRCLHAMPFLKEQQALQESLAWLLRCPYPAADEVGARSKQLAAAVRRANRRRALQVLLATLLSNAAKHSAAAWQLVIEALQSVRCGEEARLCSVLEQLPAPWSQGQQDQLAAAVSVCPDAMRSRVMRRARQMHGVAAQAVADVCSALAGLG